MLTESQTPITLSKSNNLPLFRRLSWFHLSLVRAWYTPMPFNPLTLATGSTEYYTGRLSSTLNKSWQRACLAGLSGV